MLLAGLIFFAVLTGLQSCMPGRQLANTFLQTPHKISLAVNPPAGVLKFNHKGELVEGFDSLSRPQQDSALWAGSSYMQYLRDSILLENYMNNFISELRLLGFDVYLYELHDSVIISKPQSYLLDIAQMQLDEYLYPLRDEDEFLDTVYFKTIHLNAVDYSCWFELRKAVSEHNRKALLYASSTAYDSFDGRFFNDPFTGLVRYRYSIDTLAVDDLYDMATYLGKKHAGYLYDFFLNQYIARNMLEGIDFNEYYHFNRTRKTLTPVYDDERFEVLNSR
jgi:hypothetical protein